MSDVIKLADHRKPKPSVIHNDRPLTVWDRKFTVRRTAWSENRSGGWFTFRDASDNMLFMRSGGLPDDYIANMIMAWIDGNKVGRKQALAAKGYVGDIA